MIIWGDRAAERAERTTTAAAAWSSGSWARSRSPAFVVAAILWDIPLVPVL